MRIRQPLLLFSILNDYVFKRIFASHIDLLNDLVNVIRGDAESLRLTQVLNPDILPEDITGKEIFLDIPDVDNQGRTVDVEVQVTGRRDYPEFGDTLNIKVSPNSVSGALACFRTMNLAARWTPSSSSTSWNFPSSKNAGDWRKPTKPLYDWSVFFSDVNNGAAMQRISHPEAKEAFEILKSVSATAQERKEAERRIRYVREVNAIKDYHWDEGRAQGRAEGIELGTAKGMEIGRSEGRAEGKAEGKAEGRAEGKAKGMKSLLIRQLERKFGPLSPEHQAKLDAAPTEQLERYSEALLTSSTIDAVFGY